MADDGQLRGLRQGVEAWNRWREENPEVEPDLAEASLAGVDLAEVDLERANLRGADLAGANLKRARLMGADLDSANLVGAVLEEAQLQKASLFGATLFEADLKGANLVQAVLGKAELVGANLQGADLRDGSLGGANLVRANLRGAKLDRVKLREANLGGADLAAASLNEAQLVAVNLEGANLEGAALVRADLREANLTEASLLQADFHDADLRETAYLKLDETFIRGARFSAKAKDPWSVLRRSYTESKFLFHLLFLVAFLLPYAARTMLWIGVNRSQEALISTHERIQQQLEQSQQSQARAEADLLDDLRRVWDERNLDQEDWTAVEERVRQAQMPGKGDALARVTQELGKITPCLYEQCDEARPVWQVLLSIQEGWNLWSLALALILYNVGRAVFTRQVSLLRAAEERSGYSPRWREYRWFYWTHPLMLGSLVVAVTALLVHGWLLLVGTTVVLPAAGAGSP